MGQMCSLSISTCNNQEMNKREKYHYPPGPCQCQGRKVNKTEAVRKGCSQKDTKYKCCNMCTSSYWQHTSYRQIV